MYFLSDFSLFFIVNIIKRGVFCLLELVKLYLPSLWVFFKRFHELLLELRVYYFSNHTKIIIFSSKLMKIFVYPLRLCFLKKNPARLTEETAVLSFREVSQTSLSKRKKRSLLENLGERAKRIPRPIEQFKGRVISGEGGGHRCERRNVSTRH